VNRGKEKRIEIWVKNKEGKCNGRAKEREKREIEGGIRDEGERTVRDGGRGGGRA